MNRPGPVLTIGLFLSLATVPALAVPLLSIDTQPGALGTQTSRTVNLGSTFTVDVLFSGDGSTTAPFDALTLATYFNDSGAVLGQSGSPVAGELADRSALVVDSFSTAVLPTVTSGDALSSSAAGPLSGFSDDTGLLGLASFAGAFSLNTSSETVQVLSMDFTASALGTSTLTLASILPGGTPDATLALSGTEVPVDLQVATIQVVDPTAVPLPATLGLLGLGLLLLGRHR